ncbi:hypothetical protein L0Y49_00600 [bacterium]|nr:hypothetical protein [bacterium]
MQERNMDNQNARPSEGANMGEAMQKEETPRGMDTPRTPNMITPKEEKKSAGAIVGIIVIVIILIIGGLYLLGKSAAPSQPDVNDIVIPPLPTEVPLSNSSDIESIEADLQNTSTEGMTDELDSIDMELNEETL